MGYDAASNSIISSFRGTETTINWIIDFDFKKVNYTYDGCQDCRVHQGFNAAYNSMAADIESYVLVLTAKYPTARVVVTGHSLGGAEAVLAAAAQARLGLDVHLFTYGCPRVGE